MRRPPPRPHGTSRARPSACAGATAYSLSGDVPNAEGYICPDGYDWLSEDQMYCIDAEGNLSLPNVMIFDDGPPVGGGDPGEDPCWYCDPGEDECYDPAGFCIEDGQGGGFPPFPRDPCEEDNPPAWCYNRCDTGDPLVNRMAFQEHAEALWAEGYGYDVLLRPQMDRYETGSFVYQNPDGSLRFEAIPHQIAVSCRLGGISTTPPSPNPIAVVHIHPFSDQELVTDPFCYGALGHDVIEEGFMVYTTRRESDADRRLTNHFNIPVYAFDAEHILRLNPEGGATTFDRCGY